jgi:hypothetical protein
LVFSPQGDLQCSNSTQASAARSASRTSEAAGLPSTSSWNSTATSIRDSEAFCAQIRNLFDLARQSVDEELAADRPHPADARSTRSTGRGNGRQENSSAENRGRANGNSVRHATSSQLRAIRAICERLNRDPEQFANQRFRVNRIEELTLQEASSLIDELKSTAGNGQQRGGTR